jgi:hypothetical protein
LVINNVMVEYKGLITADGSVSVNAVEPDLTISVNAGEKGGMSFRTFIFQPQHIVEPFVCLESRVSFQFIFNILVFWVQVCNQTSATRQRNVPPNRYR